MMIFRTTLIGVALGAAAPAVAQQAAPPAVAAPDPARLAAAQRAVAALVPEGIYMTMMRDKFPQMTDAMMARTMGMTARDIGAAADGGDGDGETLGEMAAKEDPAFRERMAITTRVMSEEMGGVFAAIEPRVRAGLARAFARKFSAQQLGDMNAFFATPSGAAFAREYLLTFMDPEVMQEMVNAMPEMMKAMPAIMAKAEQATAHLPKPKTPGAKR